MNTPINWRRADDGAYATFYTDTDHAEVREYTALTSGLLVRVFGSGESKGRTVFVVMKRGHRITIHRTAEDALTAASEA